MTTVLLAYAGLTAVLTVLLVLVIGAQAVWPALRRRDVAPRAGAAPSGVEAAVREPQTIGSR